MDTVVFELELMVTGMPIDTKPSGLIIEAGKIQGPGLNHGEEDEAVQAGSVVWSESAATRSSNGRTVNTHIVDLHDRPGKPPRRLPLDLRPCRALGGRSILFSPGRLPQTFFRAEDSPDLPLMHPFMISPQIQGPNSAPMHPMMESTHGASSLPSER